jgi:hypothetical protein
MPVGYEFVHIWQTSKPNPKFGPKPIINQMSRLGMIAMFSDALDFADQPGDGSDSARDWRGKVETLC